MCGKQEEHSVQNEGGSSYAAGQKEDSRALSVVAEQGPQFPSFPEAHLLRPRRPQAAPGLLILVGGYRQGVPLGPGFL